MCRGYHPHCVPPSSPLLSPPLPSPLLPPPLPQSKGRLDQVSYLQSSCCSTVTQLAISDASALAIVQDNGVYILANFIRPHPSKRVGKPLINLQCHALRALRFLFSLERNRRILRRCLYVAQLLDNIA